MEILRQTSETVFKSAFSPLLDQADSETWHIRAREGLNWLEQHPPLLQAFGLVARGGKRFYDSRQEGQIGNTIFPNRCLLATGWDKTGETLKAWEELGAAGVVVGTVLERPQVGNPKPRQFFQRVSGKTDGVALNRLGFNSPGMQQVRENLLRYKDYPVPIIVSAGKNNDVDDDHSPEANAAVIEYMNDFVDIWKLGISSPNTKGLRGQQDKIRLRDIVQACHGGMDLRGGRKPMIPKLAPDLTLNQLDDILEVVESEEIIGLAIGNTTIREDIKADYGWKGQMGGFSGDDPRFRCMSLSLIAHARRSLPRLIIIGIGGIKNGSAALENHEAGADFIGLNTAVRSQGPGVFHKITTQMSVLMDHHEAKPRSVDDLVGIKSHLYI